MSRDVREVVDSAQANLMRVFAGDEDSVVRFSPMSPEDVEGAKTATEFVQDCLINRNNGISIINTWIKDSILQKNGIVKWHWSEWKEIDKIPFKDMPEEEMDFLLAQHDDTELDYDPEETTVTDTH